MERMRGKNVKDVKNEREWWEGCEEIERMIERKEQIREDDGKEGTN